jgi:hypothetical protein
LSDAGQGPIPRTGDTGNETPCNARGLNYRLSARRVWKLRGSFCRRQLVTAVSQLLNSGRQKSKTCPTRARGALKLGERHHIPTRMSRSAGDSSWLLRSHAARPLCASINFRKRAILTRRSRASGAMINCQRACPWRFAVGLPPRRRGATHMLDRLTRPARFFKAVYGN